MCPLKQLFLYRTFPTGDTKRQRENLHRFDRSDLQNDLGGLARGVRGECLEQGPGEGQFRPQGGQGESFEGGGRNSLEEPGTGSAGGNEQETNYV